MAYGGIEPECHSDGLDNGFDQWTSETGLVWECNIIIIHTAQCNNISMVSRHQQSSSITAAPHGMQPEYHSHNKIADGEQYDNFSSASSRCKSDHPLTRWQISHICQQCIFHYCTATLKAWSAIVHSQFMGKVPSEITYNLQLFHLKQCHIRHHNESVPTMF